MFRECTLKWKSVLILSVLATVFGLVYFHKSKTGGKVVKNGRSSRICGYNIPNLLKQVSFDIQCSSNFSTFCNGHLKSLTNYPKQEL